MGRSPESPFPSSTFGGVEISSLPERVVGSKITPRELITLQKDILWKTSVEERILQLLELKTHWFITGPPGSGKSTIIQGIIQMYHEAVRNGLIPEKKIHLLEYETYFAEFFAVMRGYGIELPGSLAEMAKQGLKKYILKFETFLTRRLIEDILKIDANDQQPLVIIELPAVGDFPRGQHVLETIGASKKISLPGNRKSQNLALRKLGRKKMIEKMMTHNRFNEIAKNTCVFRALADQRIYENAKIARDAARTCQNDYELKGKLLRLGLNYGEPQATDVISTKLLERFMNMASPQAVDGILREFDHHVAEVISEIWKNEPTLLNLALKSDELLIKNAIGPEPDKEADELLQNAYRALASYRDLSLILGGNYRDFIVAFNPAHLGGIDYSGTIEEESKLESPTEDTSEAESIEESASTSDSAA